MRCEVVPGSCGGGTGRVVISELSVAGTVADDEFIELYNAGDGAVDLSTWAMHYKSATGATWSKRNLTGTIAARGHFLIGHTGYVGAVVADMTQGTLSFSGNANGGNVAITDNQNTLTDLATAVDRVAYGATANAFEGTAAAAMPAASGSIERKANAASTDVTMAPGGVDATAGNARDSNDNAADFVLRATREPQNAASADEP